MDSSNKYIGKPVPRVDGVDKVTGTARYAAEFHFPGMAYGVVVSSTIAKGRIRQIDTTAALARQGVLAVFTHLNTPRLALFNFSYIDMDAPPGKHFRYFQTDRIYYNQQPVALVVAETFEQARYAATLVAVAYEEEASQTDLETNLHLARKPKGKRLGFRKPFQKGHFDQAFRQSHVQVEAGYGHGAEHHNPMEMFASTVVYKEGGKLVIYDKTQGVFNSLKYVCGVFSLAYKDVEVKSPFVGGAFGSGLRPQYQLFMAVLAALQLKRPVQVALTRQQMFSFGHRPATLQTLALGATADGTLQALKHTAVAETSRFEDYAETVVNWGTKLYTCGNVQQDHKILPLDVYTPLDMRAPGGVTGVYALECAIDELAYKLQIDPVAFRLKNDAEKDGETGKPFSSKGLRDCFARAAAAFGWDRRPLEAGIQQEGNLLIGQGMASGIWDALLIPARAKAVLHADGRLEVGSGTADIGTGTYTIMTQIAAEALGLPLEAVTFRLGDTALPLAFIEGGSATAASVGTAVQQACLDLRTQLLKLAKKITGSPFEGVAEAAIAFGNGALFLKADPAVRLPFTEILRQTKTRQLQKTATALPNLLRQMGTVQNTHAAHFAEVAVDAELGTITVRKVVSAVAAGRILNPQTARSQILGGIVWGISMALQEHSVMDHSSGRFINHNLAEYHVPVHADIHRLQVIFVEEEDKIVNPLGVKGVGEIGMVGVAAAIANAVFHATGKRVRNLPITLDQLL